MAPTSNETLEAKLAELEERLAALEQRLTLEIVLERALGHDLTFQILHRE